MDLVLNLIEHRLAYEPWSMYRSVRLLGGAQWFGWSLDTAKASDLVDVGVLGAKASAVNPRVRLRDRDRSERPSPVSQRPARPRSLMEDFSSFLT